MTDHMDDGRPVAAHIAEARALATHLPWWSPRRWRAWFDVAFPPPVMVIPLTTLNIPPPPPPRPAWSLTPAEIERAMSPMRIRAGVTPEMLAAFARANHQNPTLIVPDNAAMTPYLPTAEGAYWTVWNHGDGGGEGFGSPVLRWWNPKGSSDPYARNRDGCWEGWGDTHYPASECLAISPRLEPPEWPPAPKEHDHG
jgi:hypothetical protein